MNEGDVLGDWEGCSEYLFQDGGALMLYNSASSPVSALEEWAIAHRDDIRAARRHHDSTAAS